MQAQRERLRNAASWLLFSVALALAGLMSVVLIEAERIWGLKQVLAAGPPYVLLLIYLVSMPLVFGTLGCSGRRLSDGQSLGLRC